MQRIGIGVTTYNRPECLAKWKQQFLKHTFDIHKVEHLLYGHQGITPKNKDYVIQWHIADDSKERKGVAFRKNECLRALKDCDYVFLFDDDCWPIKDGWIEFFINGTKPGGYKHFLFLNDRLHTKIGRYNNIDTYRDCGGVFMFLTKEDIERVGAFNEKFTPYGFEHAEYSKRIAISQDYMMLVGTENYLYSEDYSNPNHKSSISDEEKSIHVKNNWDKFFKERIKSIYLPL